jgi:hypothetical protein
MEVIRYHDEGSGPADDVVSVVILKSADRIGVVGDPNYLGRPPRLARHFRRDQHCLCRRPIYRWCAGWIERRAVELGDSEVDTVTDRGTVGERAWNLPQSISKSVRRRFIADDSPVKKHPLIVGSRKLHELHRDAASGSRGGGLVFNALLDGTVAAFDDTTLDELWKVNVGSGFSAPPMTFEVNGKQYVAIVSGPSPAARSRLVNTPELKEQRNATVMYVFGL